jgi:hypothetical protein
VVTAACITEAKPFYCGLAHANVMRVYASSGGGGVEPRGVLCCTLVVM